MVKRTSRASRMLRKGQRSGRNPGARSPGSTFDPRRGAITSATLKYGQIVPDRMTVPMKYVQTFFLGSSGGQASYVYSQNSVFDPNVTSTGGSVTGFSALSALYRRYRVLSSKIRVTAQHANSDGLGVAIALAPYHTNVGTTSGAEIVAQSRFAKPHAIKILANQGYGDAVVLEDSVRTAELTGVELFDDPTLFGSGSDPGTQLYWVIGSSSISNPDYQLSLTVELEYVTEWSQAQDLPS